MKSRLRITDSNRHQQANQKPISQLPIILGIDAGNEEGQLKGDAKWISVGEGVRLPRPRIQVVHGTVEQKCARNTLPAPSGILYRPAL